MSTIGVLGGGSWGVALARAAVRAGSEVILHSRRHHGDGLKRIHVTAKLEELARSRLILIAVPSHQVRTVARELGDHVDGSHLLVHGVRGLSGPELLTISQILRDETPVRRLGALGGPVQASELAEGRPSALIVGSEYPEVAQAVRRALQGGWLLVDQTSDLAGLEWSSALVGCLAIGVGFAQQTGATPGLLALLISRGVDEAAGIAVEAGADQRTLYGLGGYGDLLASMALDDRPEVVLGRALGRGADLERAQQEAKLRIEAVDLVPRIHRFAEERGLACPLFASILQVLDGAEAEQVVRKLFEQHAS
ncbi:MAG: NAD(P)-binding domain-containing protein [Deltaproteobacteria bacterium]|jgi:glycerol-3-phosphate dehydrogenase (NAD(P)+)|nr:NAD(P)-binding domain-containing protein [Deltaproteobacteria bacterium]MBW2532544.1 NAD(P)-binding domain-containing protein [Deltaproteobacteria bacterium]